MALPDALKKEIVRMPVKEKDKLLLRLVGKDKTLVDKLYFELIEGGATTEERRAAIKARIEKVARMTQYSPGWIMMDMRSLSGDISYHVKITKDKYGDIELNLYMLNEFFEQHTEQLATYSSRSDKCALYMVKKVQTLLNKLAKLDEEYYIDFASDMEKLLHFVHSMCTKPYANQLDIPRDWN